MVDRFHHGDQTRGGVGDGESSDVKLKGNRSDVRMEAE